MRWKHVKTVFVGANFEIRSYPVETLIFFTGAAAVVILIKQC